jgi:hypothetical protein
MLRPRFTIRNLMIAIAVFAILLAANSWDRTVTALFSPSVLPLLVLGVASYAERVFFPEDRSGRP